MLGAGATVKREVNLGVRGKEVASVGCTTAVRIRWDKVFASFITVSRRIGSPLVAASEEWLRRFIAVLSRLGGTYLALNMRGISEE